MPRRDLARVYRIEALAVARGCIPSIRRATPARHFSATEQTIPQAQRSSQLLVIGCSPAMRQPRGYRSSSTAARRDDIPTCVKTLAQAPRRGAEYVVERSSRLLLDLGRALPPCRKCQGATSAPRALPFSSSFVSAASRSRAAGSFNTPSAGSPDAACAGTARDTMGRSSRRSARVATCGSLQPRAPEST
jgi:hypothetical protein